MATTLLPQKILNLYFYSLQTSVTLDLEAVLKRRKTPLGALEIYLLYNFSRLVNDYYRIFLVFT